MASLLLHPITVLLCDVLLLPEATHALWPQSRNLQTGSSALRLGLPFTIHLAGPNSQKDLPTAAERTRALIFSDKFGRIVVGRGADDLSAVWRAKALAGLTYWLLGNTSGAPRPSDGEGSAAVPSANSTLGLFPSLTTFAQPRYIASGTVYTRSARQLLFKDLPAYVGPSL
ncbi:hypothetical protein EDB84DRAFT_1558144 [Lactarius hengduanensis]|nr:hypothetical protein EDB84DRAFT_1558144 [Lactarius hengduanensis]